MEQAMSWKLGERPHLDVLPVDRIGLLKILMEIVKAGREIEIYMVEGEALKMIYPEPPSAGGGVEAPLSEL